MANWLSGYTTRKKITIDKSKIDSDLTDFPVLVKLTSSNFDFSKANSDGYDIRFTSADGTTLLKYERERHDSDNEVAEYWVKIPSISSSEDTIFYIYYRTEDTDDGADPTNVWDSNFKGVWHMKDLTTSTIEDSTSNNNDGTKKAANEPIEIDGKIAKAQDFDGTNDAITVADSDSLTPVGSYTLSLWVNVDAYNGNYTLWVGKWVETGNMREYAIGEGGTSSNRIVFYHAAAGSGSVMEYVDYERPATGEWHHITGVFNSGSNIKLYLDGAEVSSKNTAVSAVVNGTAPFKFASSEFGGRTNYLNGKIDEVRLSNTNRSAAWIKASYNSENNSLVSYGNEEGIDNAVFFGCNF